jgi:hypothetical protein
VWLPSLDSSRTDRILPLRVVVPWDRGALGLELPGRPLPNTVVRARELQAALERHGTVAGVARAYGVTKASVCQYLTLLRRLPPEVLAELKVETDPARRKQLKLRRLLEVAQVEGKGAQRRLLLPTSSER